MLDVRVEGLGEVSTRAEDQRLRRRVGDIERLGDLGVAEALPLAEQDRAPEVLRHRGERIVETEELVVRVGHAPGQALLELLQVGRRLEASAPGLAEPAREADVVGDLVEPGRLELGDDAFLESAIDAQERVLDRVLGVFARAQLPLTVALDLRAVLLVQPGCFRVGARRARRGNLLDCQLASPGLRALE